MERILRRAYIDRIRPFMGSRNAKIIAGIRRSGKTTILKELPPYAADANILAYDMELWTNRKYRDPDTLYQSIKASLDPERDNMLVIDEVQDIESWEELIRSLIAEDCCDIYLSGSNSKLLSGEFATYLGGRVNWRYAPSTSENASCSTSVTGRKHRTMPSSTSCSEGEDSHPSG